jgi:hypothetical protein
MEYLWFNIVTLRINKGTVTRDNMMPEPEVYSYFVVVLITGRGKISLSPPREEVTVCIWNCSKFVVDFPPAPRSIERA